MGLFAALVHNKKKLSNVVKFHYLLSNLADEPKELIQKLQTASENYEVAVGTLKGRYENDDKVCQILMTKVSNLPSPNHNLVDVKPFTKQAKQLIT